MQGSRMSATSTAVAGDRPRGHCCICQIGDCFHDGPIRYCMDHARRRYNVQVSTSSGWPVGPTPHADCGTECPCYWRGRRDEAKA